MRETFKKNLKYLPIVILTFLIYKLINEKGLVSNIVSITFSILVPFIWAVAIAYILNPLLKRFEEKRKLSRTVALVLTYIVALVLILGLLLIIIPSLIESITDIINESSYYGKRITSWYEDKLASINSIKEFTEVYNIDIEELTIGKIKKEINELSNNIQSYIMTFGRIVFNFTSGFMHFLIGFIVSIYFLRDKEKFAIGLTRLSRSIFGDKRTEEICNVFKIIDEVFSNYIIGKALDSLIIGIICFFGLLILRVKYAVLFSVIVGVSNMIPYFGPFIGAVPAVIITLLIDPFKAIGVVIFIFVLQQLDGYVIGPKIIGNSVGVSSFWIILSIVLGGQLFGLLGMLLAVPVITVIRQLSLAKIDKVLEDRDKESVCADNNT